MTVQIGAFTLQRQIGRGGMGEVWQATHLDQNIDIALKLMTSTRAVEERYREAFGREVRAVARLDHPAIVRVLDCGEVSAEAVAASPGSIPERSPYLAMELATGTLRDFAEHLTRWSQIRTVLLRIFDGLAHAHARGVIHRDLKPENVLVVPGPDGPRLKLADFGLAHAYQRPDTDDDPDTVTGTPRFMAPEQILGQWRDQGPWTDLYAVGCLGYWLVSGNPPYSGTRTEEILAGHLQGALPTLQSADELPKHTSEFFARLMAKNPRDRFQLASDAAHALNALRGPKEPLNREPITFSTSSSSSLSESDDPTLLGPKDRTILLSETVTLPEFDGEISLNKTSSTSVILPPLPATWERPKEGDHHSGEDRLRGVGLGLYGLRQLPLIARIGERDALWEALRLVHHSGEPLCISLSGTMGVGKTRVAEWLAERAMEVGGALMTHARHSPIEANGHGLATVVTNRLRCHGMSTDQIISRVREYYGRSGTLDVDDLQDCTAITALIAPISDPNYDPSRARVHFSSPRERYALVARFLKRTADERPLILVLDDVQWGHDTLQFMQFLLADFDNPPPILALMTVREEALQARPLEAEVLHQLHDIPGFEILEIAPLTENDHRRLVQSLLGLDSRLTEEVVERTRGNPLFAVQLVGDWVERGILIPARSGFKLQTGASARLPADIHHLLEDRLQEIARRLAPDRPEDVWRTLEVAAALGHDVDLREWKRACTTVHITPIPGLVEALTLARLAISEEFRFSFLHGAIRETLEYHARHHDRWHKHHEICAISLQDIYPPQTRWLSSRIGRHLLRGHRWQAALTPLLNGADEARIASEFSRAYDLYDRHLEALDKENPNNINHLQSINAIRRARTLIKQNKLTEGAHYLEFLEQDDLPPHIECERLFALGTLARARGNVKEGMEVAQRCIDIYQQLDPSPTLPDAKNSTGVTLPRAITLLADLQQTAGFLDKALSLSRQGLQLSQSLPYEMAAISLQRANIFGGQGNSQKSREWLEKGRKAYEEIGDRYGVAQIENSYGELYRMTDRPDQARTHYENALKILDRIGVTQLGTARFNIAMCLVEEQDFAQAHTHFQQVHQSMVASGSTGYLGLTHTALMTCAAAKKDWTTYQDQLQQARHHIQQTGLVIPDIAALYTVAMNIMREADRLEDAQLLAELARDQWTRLQRPEKAAEVEKSI